PLACKASALPAELFARTLRPPADQERSRDQDAVTRRQKRGGERQRSLRESHVTHREGGQTQSHEETVERSPGEAQGWLHSLLEAARPRHVGFAFPHRSHSSYPPAVASPPPMTSTFIPPGPHIGFRFSYDSLTLGLPRFRVPTYCLRVAEIQASKLV